MCKIHFNHIAFQGPQTCIWTQFWEPFSKNQVCTKSKKTSQHFSRIARSLCFKHVLKLTQATYWVTLKLPLAYLLN